MAKVAICDVCQQRGHQDAYGNTPEGWFTLRQSFADEQHLCSHTCLRAAVRARLTSTVTTQVVEVELHQ